MGRSFARPFPGPTDPSQPDPPPSWKQRLWWLTLAFIPSSLMLGVTTHISTDIAAVPLLWVLPLGLYLLTFVLTFASYPPISHARVRRVFPALVMPALVQIAIPLSIPVWLSISFTLPLCSPPGCSSTAVSRKAGRRSCT